MLKLFMPELNNASERLIILQQNADKVEVTTYQKPFLKASQQYNG